MDPPPEISQPDGPTYAGKRFYSPSAIFVYCFLLNVHVGLFMFGMNLHRAGRRRMGVVIIVFAAVALLFVVVTAALAGSLPILPGNPTGALVGLGLLRMQYPDYSQALARGARPERWWPPLVVVIGATVVSGALGR